MEKTVLVVGDLDSLQWNRACKHQFQVRRYRVFVAWDFQATLRVLEKEKVSLVVCFGFNDTLSRAIDEHCGHLPPIIYRYIRGVDALPKRTGVVCVDSNTTSHELVKKANKILGFS